MSPQARQNACGACRRQEKIQTCFLFWQKNTQKDTAATYPIHVTGITDHARNFVVFCNEAKGHCRLVYALLSLTDTSEVCCTTHSTSLCWWSSCRLDVSSDEVSNRACARYLEPVQSKVRVKVHVNEKRLRTNRVVTTRQNFYGEIGAVAAHLSTLTEK